MPENEALHITNFIAGAEIEDDLEDGDTLSEEEVRELEPGDIAIPIDVQKLIEAGIDLETGLVNIGVEDAKIVSVSELSEHGFILVNNKPV